MERKFGHCVANWTIENSHVLPMNFPYHILSPEFEVKGFKASKWVMKLKNEEIDGEFILKFQLNKLDSDEENFPFHGQCHVEIAGEIENRDPFRKDFIWEVNSNKRELIERLHPNHSLDILLYNLHIKCKLLIMFVSVEKYIKTYDDIVLEKLSRDLLRLYEKNEYTDVTLIIKDKNSVHYIKAHKAILQSRNTKFRNMINSNIEKVTINHSGRMNEWKNIVRFLYSADLTHVLNPPRMSYYDIAVSFNIEPIISFYEPDKLNLLSTVPVDQCSATLTIRQFLTSNEFFIQIPRLIHEIGDTKWQIHVCPISFAKKSNTCIFVEVNEQNDKTVLVELYARNAQSKDLLHRFIGKLANNGIYHSFAYLERDILNRYLEDGNLTLIFKHQMLNLNLINEYERHSVMNIKYELHSYEKEFSYIV